MCESTQWKAQLLAENFEGVPIFSNMLDLGNGQAMDWRDEMVVDVPKEIVD
jgi:hypothetical protein